MKAKTLLILAAARPPKVRRRRLRAILLAVLMAQYTIVAIIVSLSVAGILRYLVTPQIVAKFEAIEAALKRLPGIARRDQISAIRQTSWNITSPALSMRRYPSFAKAGACSMVPVRLSEVRRLQAAGPSDVARHKGEMKPLALPTSNPKRR